MKNTILSLSHIKKRYPGVLALDDVSLDFYEGETHAIVGENGAGKSTLIKVITGAIHSTEGEMYFEGKPIYNNSPSKSLQVGIVAIYQEFNLFPFLSVAENIFYGQYPKKQGIIVDFKKMEQETKRILEDLGVDIEPLAQVKDLSVGYQQIIEIAKAVSHKAKVLIMDEPSAPLTNNEVDCLFKVIERLKAQGVTILYISHRLEEIFRICDRVSVFRDGRYIQTMNVAETDAKEIIKIMVNRSLGEQFPKRNCIRGEKVLEIRNLKTNILKDISLEAYRGEILGLAGLVGAGRTEIVRALFGADKIQSGQFLLHGNILKINSPRDAIQAGIGLIPEDRKRQGVLLGMSITENISYAHMKTISRFGVIDQTKDEYEANRYMESLKIKTPSIRQKIKNLSGGNQQKVVLAKWLFTNCEVLVFDEPTRGIDVGAKQEIYRLMHHLIEQGKIIIMISSEMPELLGMADRIIVMHEGRITGEVMRDQVTQEDIMKLSSGL